MRCQYRQAISTQLASRHHDRDGSGMIIVRKRKKSTIVTDRNRQILPEVLLVPDITYNYTAPGVQRSRMR